MKNLTMSRTLTLPVAVVTEPIGIFANRGKGKSNAAHLLVEQLFHAGMPSIVLDVKGDWYGIRSSKDGKKAGLPFLILGGEHGDLPLEERSGRLVADMLAEMRVPTIIDLSAMSKTKARTWVMDFAEALYRKNREPLMLVVDEADVLISQRLSNEMMRLLGAMEDIAKRGRQRGLGITVISQRVADVNKSVTDLLETLFLFAVSGVRTRKALLEWIDDHADPQEARDVIATLSTLPPGECWVWSPGWLHILQRVVMNRIETFDSHATPAPGEQLRTARTFADVDLSVLKEAMAETIEKAKASDPAELQRMLRMSEATVQNLQTTVTRQTATISTQTDEIRQLREHLEIAQATSKEVEVLAFNDASLKHLDDLNAGLRSTVDVLGAVLDRLKQPAPKPIEYRAPRPEATIKSGPSRPERVSTQKRVIPPFDGDPLAGIDKSGKTVLSVLAQHGPLTNDRIALIAGYSPKASTVSVALSKLRRNGLVSDGQPVQITEAGMSVAVITPLPSGDELLRYWGGDPETQQGGHSSLDKSAKKVFWALVNAHPTSLSQHELAEVTGYSPEASTISVALSRLRKLRLVSGFAMSDEFMHTVWGTA